MRQYSPVEYPRDWFIDGQIEFTATALASGKVKGKSKVAVFNHHIALATHDHTVGTRAPV